MWFPTPWPGGWGWSGGWAEGGASGPSTKIHPLEGSDPPSHSGQWGGGSKISPNYFSGGGAVAPVGPCVRPGTGPLALCAADNPVGVWVRVTMRRCKRRGVGACGPSLCLLPEAGHTRRQPRGGCVGVWVQGTMRRLMHDPWVAGNQNSTDSTDGNVSRGVVRSAPGFLRCSARVLGVSVSLALGDAGGKRLPNFDVHTHKHQNMRMHRQTISSTHCPVFLTQNDCKIEWDGNAPIFLLGKNSQLAFNPYP